MQLQGDLIIGETGEVVGDINNMGSLLIDGKLVGNINVKRVCLRGQAQVFGDITCKSLQMDPTVVVVGKLNVHPKAPMVIDSDGQEVKNIPKKEEAKEAPAPRRKSSVKKGGVDGEKVIADELAAAQAKKDAEGRAVAKKKEEEEIAAAKAAEAQEAVEAAAVAAAQAQAAEQEAAEGVKGDVEEEAEGGTDSEQVAEGGGDDA